MYIDIYDKSVKVIDPIASFLGLPREMQAMFSNLSTQAVHLFLSVPMELLPGGK